MAELGFEELKTASALIDAGLGSVGTGYLVADDRVATCEHVIRGAQPGEPIAVLLGSQNLTARLTKVDAATDCAVLTLDEKVKNAAFLPLAGECRRQAVWDGYGFPGIARGAGVPLAGTVMDPKGKDTKGQDSLILFSPQVAAGMASKVHGFSGSPVMVEGVVVGHLKRILSDDEDKERPAFGYVYATPSKAVLALLDMEPAVPFVDPADTKSLRIPAAGAGQYHVFLSFASENRDFAVRLMEAFETAGFRTFRPDRDLRAGHAWVDETGAAMDSSRSAVVLMSGSWLASDWCRQEAGRLLARREREREFRVIPILLDEAQPPEEWRQLFTLDFRAVRQPEGAQLERLLYAVAGQKPPVRVMAGELAEAAQSARAEGEADSSMNWRSAEDLITLGKPDDALKLLPADSKAVRTRQLRALALAKSGDVEESVQILKALKAEGHFDAETGGLLAGRYRQLWEDTREKRWLLASCETYLEAWEKTRDTYPGVNAASMLLMMGRGGQAREIAGEIIRILEAKGTEPGYWDLSTMGETHLLLGDVEKARTWYTRAVAHSPERVQAIATMRKSARRDLTALNLADDLMNDVLSVPAAVAFVGHVIDGALRTKPPRFPRERASEVRKRIRAALQDLSVGYGVSSASDGSDILFLEEMAERRAEVRVVLPCPQGRFVKEFLKPGWESRFEKALACDTVEVIQIEDGDPRDVWEEFRPRLWKEAERLARQLDQEPYLLAVWDGKPGYVADTISDWQDKLGQVRVLPL